jgi:hypothetical protein
MVPSRPGRMPGGVSAPAVVQVQRYPLLAAQGGNADLASQSIQPAATRQHDLDLLLRKTLLARHPADHLAGGFLALFLLGYSAIRLTMLGPRSTSWQIAPDVPFDATRYERVSIDWHLGEALFSN